MKRHPSLCNLGGKLIHARGKPRDKSTHRDHRWAMISVSTRRNYGVINCLKLSLPSRRSWLVSRAKGSASFLPGHGCTSPRSRATSQTWRTPACIPSQIANKQILAFDKAKMKRIGRKSRLKINTDLRGNVPTNYGECNLSLSERSCQYQRHP